MTAFRRPDETELSRNFLVTQGSGILFAKSGWGFFASENFALAEGLVEVGQSGAKLFLAHSWSLTWSYNFLLNLSRRNLMFEALSAAKHCSCLRLVAQTRVRSGQLEDRPVGLLLAKSLRVGL